MTASSPSVSRISSSSAYESSSQSTEKMASKSTPSKPSSPVNKKYKGSKTEAEERVKNRGEKKGKKTVQGKGEKSAAKSGVIWNATDEVAFLKALAASCQKGMAFPKFTEAFCNKIRTTLDTKYEKDQLYNKCRRLRDKFLLVRSKANDKNFTFKNEQDKILYNLSTDVWGNGEKDAECSQRSEGVKRKKIHDEDREELKGKKHFTENKEKQIQVAAKSDHHNSRKNLMLSDGEGKRVATASDDRELVDLLHKENSKMMKSFMRQMLRENEDFLDGLKREMMEFVMESLQGY